MSADVFPLEIWEEGITQPRFAANDNALRVEAIERGALNFSTAAPSSPSDGDVHFVQTAWGGFAVGDVVMYRGGTWYGFKPFMGWKKYCDADSKLYVYDAGWSEVAGGGGGSSLAPVVTESGTSHNIDASESGSYLRFTSTSAKTCTFRPNSTHGLPANGEWHIRNAAASNVTLTPGAGVTLNTAYGGTLNVPPGGTVTVKRVATDVFDVMGVTA